MALRLLVVEGCSEEILAMNERDGLPFSSSTYAASLRLHAADAEIDFAYPYAPLREKDIAPLESYDGFVLTGSSVSWGAEDARAEPYLAFLRQIFKTGRPVLGSCWGMQTVAVLFGGMSGPNPLGSEIGIARNITLSDSGKNHLLFEGMPGQFDAPAYHRDHVTRVPEGAVVLAGNAVSAVQAMAIERNGIDYMGFQFHPEIPLEIFEHENRIRRPLPGTVAELKDFPQEIPTEIEDAMLRTRPLANWLKHVMRVRTIRGGNQPIGTKSMI